MLLWVCNKVLNVTHRISYRIKGEKQNYANARQPSAARLSLCDNSRVAGDQHALVEFVEALPKSGTGKVMWRAPQEKENG